MSDRVDCVEQETSQLQAKLAKVDSEIKAARHNLLDLVRDFLAHPPSQPCTMMAIFCYIMTMIARIVSILCSRYFFLLVRLALSYVYIGERWGLFSFLSI